MSRNWDEGLCNEKSGFLFSHACPRASDSVCEHCRKPICFEHQRQHEGRVLCISCVKKQNTSDGYYEDDPYFYGGYHYHGYSNYSAGYWGAVTYHHHMSHHDENDFTEADAHSLVDEDGGDFESDMSES